MRADEVMTPDVVTISPDTPASRIARLLLENHVSAVPVVDPSGSPIGMVSEGDLLRRDDADRAARRAWWLEMLAEGETLSREYESQLRTKDQLAREIMSAPVVTATEATDVAALAHLFTSYRIKRVPVVRDGRIVGIVSRVDLLRAFKDEAERAETKPGPFHPLDALQSLEQRIRRARHPALMDGHDVEPMAAPAPDDEFDIQHFRAFTEGYKRELVQKSAESREAAAAARQRTVQQLIDHHVGDETWKNLLMRAREAAQHGQREFMLLRFPHDLCSDGGRAINVPEPEWPKTLRGEAAEIYLRWERELKPKGFS
ncbi:MAG TPA: CBS domain-containing protein, partial [Dongiaceae bacterium]|nr:CBS domain-containing protein [Dongiaceae bacterium]